MNDQLSDIETLIKDDKLDEARGRIAEVFPSEPLTDEAKGELHVALALAKMNALVSLLEGVLDVLVKTGKEIDGLRERERVLTDAVSLESVREDLKA